MNNHPDSTTEEVKAPVVTFSNIPLDDDPPVPAFDSIPEPEDVTVVGVQFKKGGKVYFFDPGKLDIVTGDEVIIDTARGAEYGFCAEGNHTVPAAKVVQPLRAVIRIATDNDRRTRQEYKDKEPHAFEVCQNKILDHKLDMKLVSAEYSFDGSKILFYFTADGRVDFRDLVKDLAGVFRTRIELRQIGVRDEAKMMGGLGICGRPFCCKQFLDDFQPVSIKMAKTQSLSLNPTKISGTCGRLMCCLKYEQDAYESLIKTSPKQDSIVNTCDGKGTVTDVSLLKQTVKVRLDNDPSTVKCYHNCDICILRNGKGKKNDPPIPDDIPPLPKPAEKQPEPESITMFDETILSNYVADEPKEKPERKRNDRQNDRSQEQRPRKNYNRPRQDRKPRNSDNKPRPQKSAAPQENAKVPQKDGAAKPKSGNNGGRRRYYRGGKKSGNQNQGS
ncbi:MAG: regulatory iron-sulfur-containing complex subunit RicT [Oscillospiraceae bacterium]|nr:regulatory iron-sulfur-containing complex subunit RicT [Oscillospiraceae bacterium]